MEQVKILTARRAYEFRPDDLRLTVLSVAEIYHEIQQFFSFHVAVVATPQPMFGPIPNTLPPGVVLDFGTTQTSEGVPTPMRFLHFEPRRIVIDVAGPSSAIDWTYEQLQRILAEKKAPDGSPVIGEPEMVREYSEISVRYDFGFESLLGGPLIELARETFGDETHSVLPLGLKFQAVEPDATVSPGEIGAGRNSRGNALELRMSTRPEDRTYLSVTELPTDLHLAWLEALDRGVSKK
jgi:hypothetical protein